MHSRPPDQSFNETLLQLESSFNATLTKIRCLLQKRNSQLDKDIFIDWAMKLCNRSKFNLDEQSSKTLERRNHLAEELLLVLERQNGKFSNGEPDGEVFLNEGYMESSNNGKWKSGSTDKLLGQAKINSTGNFRKERPPSRCSFTCFNHSKTQELSRHSLDRELVKVMLKEPVRDGYSDFGTCASQPSTPLRSRHVMEDPFLQRVPIRGGMKPKAKKLSQEMSNLMSGHDTPRHSYSRDNIYDESSSSSTFDMKSQLLLNPHDSSAIADINRLAVEMRNKNLQQEAMYEKQCSDLPRERHIEGHARKSNVSRDNKIKEKKAHRNELTENAKGHESRYSSGAFVPNHCNQNPLINPNAQSINPPGAETFRIVRNIKPEVDTWSSSIKSARPTEKVDSWPPSTKNTKTMENVDNSFGTEGGKLQNEAISVALNRFQSSVIEECESISKHYRKQKESKTNNNCDSDVYNKIYSQPSEYRVTGCDVNGSNNVLVKDLWLHYKNKNTDKSKLDNIPKNKAAEKSNNTIPFSQPIEKEPKIEDDILDTQDTQRDAGKSPREALSCRTDEANQATLRKNCRKKAKKACSSEYGRKVGEVDNKGNKVQSMSCQINPRSTQVAQESTEEVFDNRKANHLALTSKVNSSSILLTRQTYFPKCQHDSEDIGIEESVETNGKIINSTTQTSESICMINAHKMAAGEDKVNVNYRSDIGENDKHFTVSRDNDECCDNECNKLISKNSKNLDYSIESLVKEARGNMEPLMAVHESTCLVSNFIKDGDMELFSVPPLQLDEKSEGEDEMIVENSLGEDCSPSLPPLETATHAEVPERNEDEEESNPQVKPASHKSSLSTNKESVFTIYLEEVSDTTDQPAEKTSSVSTSRYEENNCYYSEHSHDQNKDVQQEYQKPPECCHSNSERSEYRFGSNQNVTPNMPIYSSSWMYPLSPCFKTTNPQYWYQPSDLVPGYSYPITSLNDHNNSVNILPYCFPNSYNIESHNYCPYNVSVLGYENSFLTTTTNSQDQPLNQPMRAGENVAIHVNDNYNMSDASNNVIKVDKKSSVDTPRLTNSLSMRANSIDGSCHFEKGTEQLDCAVIERAYTTSSGTLNSYRNNGIATLQSIIESGQPDFEKSRKVGPNFDTDKYMSIIEANKCKHDSNADDECLDVRTMTKSAIKSSSSYILDEKQSEMLSCCVPLEAEQKEVKIQHSKHKNNPEKKEKEKKKKTQKSQKQAESEETFFTPKAHRRNPFLKKLDCPPGKSKALTNITSSYEDDPFLKSNNELGEEQVCGNMPWKVHRKASNERNASKSLSSVEKYEISEQKSDEKSLKSILKSPSCHYKDGTISPNSFVIKQDSHTFIVPNGNACPFSDVMRLCSNEKNSRPNIKFQSDVCYYTTEAKRATASDSLKKSKKKSKKQKDKSKRRKSP